MMAFSTSGTLSRHTKTIHEAFRPEACPHCSSRFRDKYTLKKHLPMHDEDHILKRKNRALDWEGAEKAMLEESKAGAIVKEEAKQQVVQEARVEEQEVRREEQEAGEMEGSAVGEEEEDNLPEENVPFPHKRVFEIPSKVTPRSQRFECYVCEERFDLFEFQNHVRGHTEDLRTTKDQLLTYMEKYSGSTEKMNATIASLIAQGECD